MLMQIVCLDFDFDLDLVPFFLYLTEPVRLVNHLNGKIISILLLLLLFLIQMKCEYYSLRLV